MSFHSKAARLSTRRTRANVVVYQTHPHIAGAKLVRPVESTVTS